MLQPRGISTFHVFAKIMGMTKRYESLVPFQEDDREIMPEIIIGTKLPNKSFITRNMNHQPGADKNFLEETLFGPLKLASTKKRLH